MANNKDPEIKGTIGMDYDSTGADEAKADLKETAATSEQAAQKSAAASEKEAERQKQLAQMMRLTLMTRKELRAEIQRLMASQKAAASVKNAKAYEELAASINRAKEAMEKLNTAQQVGMIAMQQQAQTGMQFAQGLGSMKTAAEQGAAGLATMATQAIALGMAIKAGLGPIGWVMAALQGLGMIVTHFTEKSKKEEEAIKATTAALKEQAQAMEDLAETEEKNKAAVELAEADDEAADIRRAGEKEVDALRDNNEKARAEREKGLRDQRAADEKERQQEAEAVRTGQMSPEVAEARERERAAKREAAEKAAEEAAAAEEKVLLEREKKLGDELLSARNKAFIGIREHLSFQDAAALTVEDKALQVLVQQADAAKAREEELDQKLDEAQKAYDEDDSDRNKEVLDKAHDAWLAAAVQHSQLEDELALRTKEQVAILEDAGRLEAETAEGKSREAVAIMAGLNAARKGVEEQEAANKAVDEKLAALEQQQAVLGEEKAELDAAAESAGKEAQAAATSAKLAEQWKEVQKLTQPVRIAWLREHLEALEDGTELERQYRELLYHEIETQATAARQEEWQRVQREKSLADQATWLRAMAEDLEYGSEEAKRWAEQLRQVETRQIQEALGNLEKDFKVTGNYVAEDKRTQRQILLDDKKALEGRAARLRGLIGETTDFALRRQLQEKLDDTVKQQKALEEATAANAKACRAMLKGYKAPSFHTKNKMVEGNLKRLGHAYARNIRLAEKAAERGDTKAQERYTRLAGKYADKITRTRKDFAAEHKKNLDALQAAQKKQKDEEEESAKDSKRNRARKNREEGKKKPKDEKPKQPEKPKEDPKARQQEKKEQELADTKEVLKSTREALSDMSSKVSDLAEAAADISTAAGQIAKSAGSSLKTLKKQLKAMKTDIANLWKEVDA